MSTFKQKFNKKHNQPLNKSNSLKEISKLSGYEMKGLKTIYNKGIGAYKTNPQSVRPQVKSAEQWAMARVYASINPQSKAYKIDKVHLKKNGEKKLTKRQEDTLKRHKEHHTKRHMDTMRKEMLSGKTFTQAHNIALKKVGK